MAETTPRKAPRRLFLIAPVAIAAILLLGYVALWFVGARAMRTEVAAFIADERAAGRIITYDDIGIKGFPVSVRAVVEGFTWSEPGAWVWQGETLHIAAQPWDLGRLVLAPRGAHTVNVGGEPYGVDPGTLRFGLADGQYGAEGREVTIRGTGNTVSLGTVAVNFEGTSGETADWIFGGQLGDIRIDREGGASLLIPFVRMVASHEPGQNGAAIEALEVAFAGDEGPATVIGLSGAAGVDAQGYPAGRLDLTYTDTTALSAALLELGVPEAPLGTFTNLLAAYRAGADDATIPLGARDGALYLTGLGNIRILDLPQIQRPPETAPGIRP